MNEMVLLVVGLSIGVLLGIVSVSLYVSTKINDLQSEIYDLRIQRKLLKEELQKPQGKPTPRKKRYRAKPTTKK